MDPIDTDQDPTPTTDTTTIPAHTTAELPTVVPPVPCPYGVDPTAIADCAADGGYAALTGGSGYFQLQDAIDAAAPRDTIVVCPGIWAGELQVDRGKVLAAADPTPGITTIDGGGTTRLLSVDGGTVRGLRLRNGWVGPYGEVAPIEVRGAVVLECLVVEDNAAINSGVVNAGGDPNDRLTVIASAFARNRSGWDGGAIRVEVGASLTVEDTVFVDNRAEGDGGAIKSEAASNVILRSRFTASNSARGGGALEVDSFDRNGSLTIDDTVFDGNAAEILDGGAVAASSSGTETIVITGSTFHANTTGPWGFGGAVFVETGGALDVTIRTTTFTSNIGGEGGGALAVNGEGGAMVLEGSSFEDNEIDSPGVGAGMLGILATSSAISTVGTDLTVLRNSGPSGAVFLGQDDVFDCTNCDFGSGVDDNLPVDATKAGTPSDELPLDFVL